MFDAIVEKSASSIAAELASSLASIETLSHLASQIRDIVKAHALMPLSSDFVLTLTLARGELRVGHVADRVSPDAQFRRACVEADHLQIEALSDVIASFEPEPDQPGEHVFQLDVLVYALLHELTGADLRTLAEAFGCEIGISPKFDGECWELPEHVSFVAEEALLLHRYGLAPELDL